MQVFLFIKDKNMEMRTLKDGLDSVARAFARQMTRRARLTTEVNPIVCGINKIPALCRFFVYKGCKNKSTHLSAFILFKIYIYILKIEYCF